MKITSVKTAATSGHGMHLWVKVETDAGVTGIGECVHGGTQAIAILQYLEPKIVGRDPFAIDAIFEDLRRSHVFDGGFAGALAWLSVYPVDVGAARPCQCVHECRSKGRRGRGALLPTRAL